MVVERGVLTRSDEYLNLARRVLVLTDREIPKEYVDEICLKCLYPVRVAAWPGEDVNSIENYQNLCRVMLENSFSEKDCVVAVGGERILQLGGFLAATYKGGVDYYCVPTTFSAQIGNGFFGKSFISCAKTPGALGAQKLPKRVLVDAKLLETLPQRKMSNGYAEVIKLALAVDKKMFDFLEKDDLFRDKSTDFIVLRSLEVKNYIYRNSKTNPDPVNALKLGALVADGMQKTQFSYGERLAIGMIPMCAPEIRPRLRALLAKVGLPVVWQYDVEKLFRDSLRGKELERVPVVLCNEIGKAHSDSLTIPEYHKLLKETYG